MGLEELGLSEPRGEKQKLWTVSKFCTSDVEWQQRGL